MTKPGRTASSTARVLGQVGTGAAFAVLFGLAGAATANAREVKAQQPPHRCAGDCSGNRSGGDKISKSLGDLKHETAKALEKFANEKPKGDKRMVRRDDSKKNSRKKDNSKKDARKKDETKKDDKPRKDDRDNDKDRNRDRDDRDKDKKDRKSDKDKRESKDEKSDRNRRHKDKDKPKKDRGERSGGERRHDDDDGGKSEKDRRDDRPSREEWPSITQVSRVRPASATSVPAIRPVSLTTSPSSGGILWGDDNGFAPPGCSDDDGCDQAFNYLDWITRAFQGPAKAIQDAFTPDDNGFDVQGPDGKGKIFSIEGHSYYAKGKWSTPDGKIEGEYSIGVDGKLELKLEKMLLPKLEASALLGARVTGPEMEVPMGPLLAKIQPEISAGIGAEFGAGFERGEDGKFRLQGKGGVTGPLGGSTGFEVSPKDDVLRLDREPHK